MWTKGKAGNELTVAVAVLLAGLLFGCSGSGRTRPGQAGMPDSSEREGGTASGHTAAPEGPDPGRPAGPSVPRVTALVVVAGGDTYRSEGYDERRTLPLVVEGETQLSLDVSGAVDRVEYWLGEDRVAVADGPGPALWTPEPGAQGELYALAWQGRLAVRSPEVWVQRPLPLDIICPGLIMPLPPDAEVADGGEILLNPQLNQVVVTWGVAWNWNKAFQLPMTADPASCADPGIAGVLRTVQADSGASTEGMLAPLQHRLQGLTGRRPVLGSAVLAAYESHRAMVDVLAMTPELDDRQYWRFRVELDRDQDGWQVTDVTEATEP